MGKISSILFCLIFQLLVGNKWVWAQTDNFERTETLSDSYTVNWRVDFKTNRVTFQVSAKTIGFVGFGISSNGNMKGADIVIGGINDTNGKAYFEDRHGVGIILPEIDEQQNWHLVAANQTGEFTHISFYRDFETCDELEDMGITSDTQYIIWSFGESDILEYHGNLNRGAKAINFLDPPSPPLDISDLKQFRIEVNSSVSNVKDTVYWCTAHKTTINKKIQIIGFEVILESPEALKYVHHLILHKCTGSNIADVIEPFLDSEGGECYDSDDPIYEIISHCNTYFYVWAKGGDRLLLPEHVGLPVGSEDEADEYYLVEVHYDNPKLDQDVHFETGITVFLAEGEDMRPNDAGLFHVGHEVSPSLTIPPNVTDFTIVGHCSSNCTGQAFPSEGLNFFNIMLHSHLNGRQLKLRHFRDGEELPWIAYDNNYDFNYQQNRALRTEINVKPGDHLSYECTYDTTWQNPPSATHGGLSTRHEMCETFILYYPLTTEIEFCQSRVSKLDELLKSFGIEAMFEQDADTPVVTAPPELAGRTYEEILNNRTLVDWTPEFLADVQQRLRFSEHMCECRTNINSRADFEGPTNYPKIDAPYQPPQPNCKPDTDSSSTPETDSSSSTPPGEGKSTTPSGAHTVLPIFGTIILFFLLSIV